MHSVFCCSMSSSFPLLLQQLCLEASCKDHWLPLRKTWFVLHPVEVVPNLANKFLWLLPRLGVSSTAWISSSSLYSLLTNPSSSCNVQVDKIEQDPQCRWCNVLASILSCFLLNCPPGLEHSRRPFQPPPPTSHRALRLQREVQPEAALYPSPWHVRSQCPAV